MVNISQKMHARFDELANAASIEDKLALLTHIIENDLAPTAEKYPGLVTCRHFILPNFLFAFYKIPDRNVETTMTLFNSLNYNIDNLMKQVSLLRVPYPPIFVNYAYTLTKLPDTRKSLPESNKLYSKIRTLEIQKNLLYIASIHINPKDTTKTEFYIYSEFVKTLGFKFLIGNPSENLSLITKLISNHLKK